MKNRKIQAQTKAINGSYILICCLLVAALVFSTTTAKANVPTHEISEVFIESGGNNKHEAKIKAHELGMRRALLLVADKLSIPTESISHIPYHELKEAFTTVSIINEVSLLEKYSATITYSYKRGHLYALLLEYADETIDDMFYETLVIPVFKQRNILKIWDNDKKWNDFWIDSRNILDTHKIFFPKKTLYLSQKITQENLFDLKLEDFMEIFHDKLFKTVTIVSAEFFTNRRTAESLMQVKKHILTPGNSEAEIVEMDYDLATWDDIPYTVDLVIDKMIDDHGALRISDLADDSDDNLFDEQEEQKPIIMNFDVFDEEELELVIAKLEKVDQIDSFAIEHDYNSRYKILIYTSVSEYELAEGLYLNGLSYKIHGSLYNLIDIKKGG